MKTATVSIAGAALAAAAYFALQPVPDPSVPLPDTISATPPNVLSPAPLMAAAAAATPAPAVQPMAVAEEAAEPRQPVLCGFWALQKFAEQIGVLDASQGSISDTAYPVPAPVWVMNAFLTAGQTRDS